MVVGEHGLRGVRVEEQCGTGEGIEMIKGVGIG